MSSRHLHPLACRLPREERNAIVTIAVARGISVSGLLKAALRHYLSAVHSGVNAGPILPAATDVPHLSATGPQSSQSRGLAQAFAAGLPVAPTGRKSNERKGWVETNIGMGSTFLNRRLKPRPQRQSPNKFVDTF
jgi:hypothetical protein